MRERFLSEKNLATATALDEFARKRGHTLLELAFSWLTSHAVVASVIAGASTPEQVRANAGATNWQLTPEELRAIDGFTQR